MYSSDTTLLESIGARIDSEMVLFDFGKRETCAVGLKIVSGNCIDQIDVRGAVALIRILSIDRIRAIFRNYSGCSIREISDEAQKISTRFRNGLATRSDVNVNFLVPPISAAQHLRAAPSRSTYAQQQWWVYAT